MNLLYASPGQLWWRPFCRSDRKALLAMFVVPTLFFVVPALAGHPALTGDNLIQNFPLRVLSGRQLASGHLPLFNPFANSGTPLLGGLNAGALYPLTGIFAFVAPIAAWVINCIAVYVIAATGMFGLLRAHEVATKSAFAAAMTYAFSGAMMGQIVHLGVVQGFAFIPWTVLILLSLSRRLSLESRQTSWIRLARIALPWLCGYALLWGLTFLTGEPRAIADMELLSLVVAPTVLILRSSFWIHTWRARIVFVGTLGVGLAWGVATALVQLLPGQSFIGSSQRSVVTYGFFGSGSLPVRWTSLLFVPDIFGGNGSGNQPGFFAHYNLAEVTGYVGVLSLMATFAFFTRCSRRGWRGTDRDFVLYLVLTVVGLFATWGSYTPLGHLFRAIPLYGNTRLQSRNVIIVDFAMTAFLGWWFNKIERRNFSEAGVVGRAKWVTAAPALAIGTFCAALMVWAPQIVAFFGVFSQQKALANGMRLSYGLHLAIALVAILAVVLWRYRDHVMRIFFGVLCVDVVFFLMFAGTGIVDNGALTMPSRAYAASVLGTSGRTALIDQGGLNSGVLHRLGVPNMNVFTNIPSVQGYGSLESTDYSVATGTHPQGALDPCRLAEGTFAQLRLATIGISTELLGNLVNNPVLGQAHCEMAPAATHAVRYFGRLLQVHSITISGRTQHAVARGPVTLRLLDARGNPGASAMVEPGAHVMTFQIADGSSRVAGFELDAKEPVTVATAQVAVTIPTAATYDFDSPLQQALDAPQWHLTNTLGTLSIFKTKSVRPADWLLTPRSGNITQVHEATWGDTWVTLHVSAKVALVRSMTYLPGWRVTAHNVSTHKNSTLLVQKNGLIQKVVVPAGRWVIHFHYHAPYIETGLIFSIGATALLIIVVLVLVANERRLRKVRSLSASGSLALEHP
jgi:hypothetical protein